jgi:hypothetical protein
LVVGLVSNVFLDSGPFYTFNIAMIFVRYPTTIISRKVLTSVLVAVQNYITAIIIFLVIEMLMTWGFYGE